MAANVQILSKQAAQRLGVTVPELKRRLADDWKDLRSFRAGLDPALPRAGHRREGPFPRAGERPRASAQRRRPPGQVAETAREDTDLPIPMSSGPASPRPASPRPASPKPRSPGKGGDEPLILADDDFFTLAPDDSASGKAKPGASRRRPAPTAT